MAFSYPLRGAVFSPDGTRLATTSTDETILWDTSTGKELLRVGPGDVGGLTFSPDGGLLAIAGRYWGVWVWDADTGKHLLSVNPFVSGLAFSPDGTRLAVANGSDTRVWDVSTGEELLGVPFRGSWTGTHRDAFSPDSTRLATVSHSNWAGITTSTVVVQDASTGRELLRVSHRAFSTRIHKVAFSPDGQRLAIACGGDSAAQVWDVDTGREPLRVAHRRFLNRVGTAVFNSDGTRLATASDDGSARIWDADSGEELLRIVHNGPVRDVAFSPDGSRLVTACGGQDKSARIWNIQAVTEMIAGTTGTVAAAGPVRRLIPRIRAGHGAKPSALLRVRSAPRPISGRLPAFVNVLHAVLVAVLSLALGGAFLVAGVFALTVAVNDRLPTNLRSAEQSLYHIFHSIPGSFAVTTAQLDGRPVVVYALNSRILQVQDLKSGKSIGRFGSAFGGHLDEVTAVATAELDSQPIAVSGGKDNALRVWYLRTGEQIGSRLTGHTDWVTGVATAELDGRPVAVSASDDTTLRVWDLRNHHQLGAPLIGHTGPVNTVVTAELDGRPIAVSGGEDGTLRIWDLHTGKQVGQPLTAHSGPVHAVATAQLDGRPVAVSGGDRTMRIWDLRTSEQVGPPLTTPAHEEFDALATAQLDGDPVVISGESGKTAREWDPRTGKEIGFYNSPDETWGVAVAQVDGQPVEVVFRAQDREKLDWDLVRLRPVHD